MKDTLNKIVAALGERLFLRRNRSGSSARRPSDASRRERLVSELGDRLYLMRTRMTENGVGARLAAIRWPAWVGAWRSRFSWRWAAAGLVACLALAVTGVALTRRPPMWAGAAAGREWYFDTASGKTFIAPAALWTTAGAPEQPPAIRARLIYCGANPRSGHRFVGYLEKITPEARAILARPNPEPASEEEEETLREGRLVSPAEGQPHWLPVSSPDGVSVIRAALRSCDGPYGFLPPVEEFQGTP